MKQAALLAAPFLLLALLIACTGAGPAPGLGTDQAKAPEFTLESLDGAQVSLGDLTGKVVLVNLWATWCPPCKAELPVLEAAYAAHKDQGFMVLGIDIGESQDVVASFAQKMGITYPVLLDGKGTMMSRLRAVGLPTSVLVDRGGTVQERQQGELSRAELNRWLNKWLLP